MKIATWNLGKRIDLAQWKYLDGTIDADILFLQECNESFLSGLPSGYSVIFKKVPKLTSGVAIISKKMALMEVPFTAFPGRVAIATVPFKGKQLCLINIHNFPTGGKNVESDEYRSNLSGILDKLAGIITTNKENLVLGGDTNVWLVCDRTKNYAAYDREEDRKLLKKINSLGLINSSDKEVDTHIKKSREFPNDYLFACGCKILNYWVFDIPKNSNSRQPVSDHKPLLIEID